MKRITLIAAALCALLLGTVGAGTVTAQAKMAPPPEFKVMQFDVTYGETVVGTITVNLQQETFVVNAHGLMSGAKAYLYCQVGGQRELIASAQANENGDLHMQGSWTQAIDLTAGESPTFFLQDRPLPGVYAEGTWLFTSYVITPVSTTVYGHLYCPGYVNGQPAYVGVPQQQVVVYRWNEKEDKWVEWGTGTTNDDGYFSVTKAFSYRSNFRVVFHGGSYDGQPYDPSVDFPKWRQYPQETW